MIGIFVGLLLLVILAYRGYSIIWVAPICATVVAIFGGLDLLPSYTELYMSGLVEFTKSWFPIFLLGAMFGKVMEVSGSAASVAEQLVRLIGKSNAILAIVIGCAVLTYGGISLFVVVFAMYPLTLALFKEADIPRKLIPGTIALGAFTFTMTALPGSPQLNNLIPTKYFGTTPMAAPIIGITSAAIMLGLGYWYLRSRQRAYQKADLHFEEGVSITTDHKAMPHFIVAILPLLTVVVTLNVCKLPIVLSLLLGVVLTMILNYQKMSLFASACNKGAEGAVQAILNTSAAVGFGTVVKAVPGFTVLVNALLGMNASPLISESLAVTMLAGATGSSSGGMGIALEALGPKYMEIAGSLHIDPEVFHRIAAIASGGLDSLPHCGAVITLLAVTGMSHKDSYKDIGMVTCVIPLLATVVAVMMGMLGIV